MSEKNIAFFGGANVLKFLKIVNDNGIKVA